MESEKLMPCRVCGCKNVIVVPVGGKKYICECDHCGYCSAPKSTKQAAMNAWKNGEESR